MKLNIIEGKAIPLVNQDNFLRNDIDTDIIIPARFLKSISFEGIEKGLFYDDRENSKENHPLNDGKYSGAKILYVGKNFGCGSSREHAPQAIKRSGISVIIGESFAGIFTGNSFEIGMPLLTLKKEELYSISKEIIKNPHQVHEIDILKKTLQIGKNSYNLGIGEKERNSCLNGTWDNLQNLLNNKEKVLELSKNSIYNT